jgi:AcrR family transcriptional regulator
MTKSTDKPKGHRDRLLPLVAAGFAELGYRAATTAELARRCGVRENVLYRVWPSKQDMFVAAVEYVFASSLDIWRRLLAKGGKGSAAQRLLEYEATHHGEFGLYRIVFAGLSETEDPHIREAMRQMYLRFHAFILEQLRKDNKKGTRPEDELTGWAIIGLATVSNISRELDLMGNARRQSLFQQMGNLLLGGASA